MNAKGVNLRFIITVQLLEQRNNLLNIIGFKLVGDGLRRLFTFDKVRLFQHG